MKKEVAFITGNKHKFEIASAVLNSYGINVKNIDMDIPELQLDDIEEVSKKKAEHAVAEIGCPLITTDVGFSIPALNGFPGPYGKYVFNKLGVEGVLALMKGKEDRSMSVVEVLSFVAPDQESKIFQMTVEMLLLTEPQGGGTVMDQLMLRKGEEVSYGSFTKQEQLAWWVDKPNYFHDFAKWYVK